MKKILFFMLMLNFDVSATDIVLPKPSGPYNIGHKTVELIDEDRVDPYLSPAQNRRVKAYLYYPTRDEVIPEPYPEEEVEDFLAHLTDGDSSYTTYFKHQIRTNLTKGSALYGRFEEIIKAVKVFQKKDAVLAPDTAFPVVYFVPHVFMNAGNYLTFVHEIASHGYVVVVTAHPSLSARIHFADGTVVETIENVKTKLAKQTIADDVAFIAQEIENNSPGKEVNFEDIAVIGHEWGGKALTMQEGPLGTEAKIRFLFDMSLPENNTKEKEPHLATHLLHSRKDSCHKDCSCIAIEGLSSITYSDHAWLLPRIEAVICEGELDKMLSRGLMSRRDNDSFDRLTKYVVEQLKKVFVD